MTETKKGTRRDETPHNHIVPAQALALLLANALKPSLAFTTTNASAPVCVCVCVGGEAVNAEQNNTHIQLFMS